MAKVLTIHQPLAWGVFAGWKIVENRGRPTKYRGPLWIHAGVSRASIGRSKPEEWHNEDDGPFLPGCPEWKDLHYGKILGIVELVDCLDFDDAFDEGYDTTHTAGPWCWILKNPRALKTPIPATGQLGIWNFDMDAHKYHLGPVVHHQGYIVEPVE